MIDVKKILDSIEDKTIFRDNSNTHPEDWTGVDLSSLPEGYWVRLNNNSMYSDLDLENDLVVCHTTENGSIYSTYYSMAGRYRRNTTRVPVETLEKARTHTELREERKKKCSEVVLNGIRATEADFIKLQTKIARMEASGSTDTHWENIQGDSVPITLTELKEVFEYGIARAESIWDNYHAAVLTL